MSKDIINEVINNYINSKCMLREYKNPNDAETVRVCGDTLQQMYDRIIQQGSSRREITVEYLQRIIGEIRHLEEMMR